MFKEVHLGDKGETSVIGKKIEKCSCNTSAIGSIDELNSFIGLAKSKISDDNLKNILEKIQNDLFVIGSELSGANVVSISKINVDWIENKTNELDNTLPRLDKFILPGESESSANLHVARSVCRRAEREIVSLSKEEKINSEVLRYVNRLSDLIFVLARIVEKHENVKEKIWKH